MSPHFDLHLRARGERGDLHGRARGAVITERFGVDRVDGREVAEVGDEHEALRHVGERRATVAEDGRDVGKRLARLRLDPFDELAAARYSACASLCLFAASAARPSQ